MISAMRLPIQHQIKPLVVARLTFLVFLSILLIACSRPTLKLENVVFGKAELLENWRLEGRIGIQLPNDSWQSSIHWNQQGGDFKISLYSPFGRILGRVEKQADEVLLIDGDGQTHHRSSKELDYLVSEQLGVPVPISSLRYWVLGQPQPNQSWQLLDSSKGESQGFSQAGWDIRFHRWSLSAMTCNCWAACWCWPAVA